MEDFKTLIQYCDHKIYDQVLTIDGMSPSYVGTVRTPTTKNSKVTFIRNYNDTAFLDTIVASRDGITNYLFDAVDNTKINFTFDGSMNSIDGRTGLIPQNVYLIDYVAPLANCPKCLGTGFVKDIDYNGKGDIVLTEGTDKLKQVVLKAILTVLGKNTYDEQYGSSLNNLLGTAIDNFTAIRLQNSIQLAVAHEIEIQNTQNLLAEERILRLNDIYVYQDSIDPTILNIRLEITDGNWQPTFANFQLKTE